MPFIEHRGLRLHYREHNPRRRAGPAALLLHGLGSCGEDWVLQLPALTPRYPVLAPDLPGHGRSDPLPGWPRMGDFAAAVADLLLARREPPAHVVGLSLGGAVALQLALDRPDLVRSLTLVNTFARIRTPRRFSREGTLRMLYLFLGRMDRLGEVVAGGLFPDENQEELRHLAARRLASNRPLPYLKAVLAAMRFDQRARLGEIRAPTLVVAGDRDRTVAMEAKEELARGIPGARLVVIAGSGHATTLDAADEFNRVLLEFLAEVDRESG